MTKLDASEARKSAGPTSSSTSPPAARRGACLDPAIELRVLGQIGVELGQEVAGADAINLNVVLGPFNGHAAGQLLQATLRGGVGRDGSTGDLARQRADVDDLAATVRNHPRCHRSGDEEGPRQVGCKHPVPVGERELGQGTALLHASVVDEDVDAAERGLGLGDPGDHCSLVGHVKADRDRARDAGERRPDPFGVAAMDCNARAGGGEALGDGEADAGGGAGYEGGPAFEVEKVETHREDPFGRDGSRANTDRPALRNGYRQ